MFALCISPISFSHVTRISVFLPHPRPATARFQSAFLQLSSLSIPEKKPYLIRRSTLPMAEKRGTASVTVGGKSSLSSYSVVAVARGYAQLSIDASAIDRFHPSTSTCILTKCKVPLPDFLTPEESRASLFVLLNKILSSGSSIRDYLPFLISETLNSGGHCLGFEYLDLTEDERFVVEKSSAVVDGVCAILDHELHALSTIAVSLSAISCEALKADIMAFNLADSGDGNSAKDEIGVASDMKILLNGSKQVGKFECVAVSEIPRIYGSFREVVRSIHSKTRTQLNSGGRGGCEKIWAPVLSSMAVVIQYAGDSCLTRTKLNLGTLNNELETDLVGLFGKRCPDSAVLKERVREISEAVCYEDYFKLLHTLRDLLRIFSEILCWEAVSSFVSVEGIGNLVEDGEKCGVPRIENGENVIMKKKSDNKKKILGRGTSAILQFIKERLSSAEINATGGLVNLDKLVDVIFSHTNPSGQQFGIFTDKVKEILENNESRRLPKLPKGTRDFAKEKMAVREKAFSIIVEVFKRHGATSLDTPAFELRETLMGKYGEDSKLVYDLSDQGGELCSLRYDLTVPFARYVAMNGITSFKRYQIAKVYRRDNPSKGRYREFYQCDFDIAGQYEKMGPDFEVIKILTELLDELDIGNYEVKLNHRQLLDGMLEICGVPPEKFRTICSSIDKLDKLSFDQIKKEMVEQKGLTAETADKIGTFVQEKGQPDVVLARLKQSGSKFLEHKGSLGALSDLEILFKALEKSKCIAKVVFDLSLARGLDYYTGVIYEAVFKGSTQVGSIAAGGRYDGLIGMFGGKQVPAVGVSLGVERVFAIMEQNENRKNQAVRATETEVVVAVLGDDLPLAAELVGELWGAKVKAEYMVSKRVMKHIDRAREGGVPWMVIVGERESADGVVRIKDIRTNKEDVVSRSGFVQEVLKRLATS